MKPIISAHRGAADLAPENTIPAIQRAVDKGVRMIELDVRSSLDGVLYNLHDNKVDRTTDGKGRIRLMRSSRVDNLNIDRSEWNSCSPCCIPRVEKILARYHDDVCFYFDVKPGVRLETLLSMVRYYRLEKRSLFWFKDKRQARKFKKLNPFMNLKINVDSSVDMLLKLKHQSAEYVEISPSTYSEAFHQVCLKKGIKMMIDFIGNEELFAEKPEKWPVDIVNVHRIRPLMPYLQKTKKESYSV